ncbi:putative transcriptional regulator protein [Pseudorhizobium banfieldiae]|uniref:Putative transcriptional regulator protein n=1 Tax=Pseudorhizobium banfieldiae TaxID=1125847 RepID=L0NGP0_9HYPH|nr:ROK family transcriptional regulator [Pseudorhizobium banfieldiae]CAD6615334.1 ROK family transcriptional regulator [arsenite-oxidising bacterium NT-25]CCF20225.1 putative transcriptional regulator protein [Pseudorhizobium banfieldiae]
MLGKSSTELVRHQNSALVLSALRRSGRLSHTQLAEATRLSSATVSAITAELERSAIIEKSEQQAATGRGRPRVLFSQRRGCGYVITVIVSSDSIQYSLVDYAGTLLDRFAEARRGAAPEFIAAITAGLERAVERSSIGREQVLLVSISSKGLVSADAPVLVWSPVLGADAVDFRLALGAGWGGKVILNNETLLVAKALQQRLAREGEAPASLAALSLGHSIGLGIARITRDGETEISAPNFGHMLHIPGGALCRCGARGCIEAYAGFYAVLRTAFEVPVDTVPAKFVPLPEVDKIAQQARQGHRMAGFAFRQAGIALGNGLSRLLSLHGHMPVRITGPGMRYYDLMRAGVEEGLAQTHVVRLSGMPQLDVVPDEPALVFEGHLGLAFQRIDQDILSMRAPIQAAGE